MNHREPSQVLTGFRRIGVCMALLFSFASAGKMLAMGHPRPVTSRSQGKSPVPADGYLPLLGAPALRFVEDLPPVPPAPRLETTTQLKAPAIITGPDIVGGKAVTSNSARPVTRTDVRVESTAAEKTAPLSILPDENRPQVKPEDFLPYFQIPGAAPLPKSTATYTETTK